VRPNAVMLNLTDSSGTRARLKDVGPGTFSCAGAAGPFRLPLPPGAEYSIPVNLDYYWESPFTRAAVGNGFAHGWKSGGTYTLEAELGSQDYGGWKGTLVSNELQIRFPDSSAKTHR